MKWSENTGPDHILSLSDFSNWLVISLCTFGSIKDQNYLSQEITNQDNFVTCKKVIKS